MAKKIYQRQGYNGKWRYTFMIQDPEYLKAWKRVQELRKQAKYPPEYHEKKGDTVIYPYLSTPEGKEERGICKKFGLRLALLLDPGRPISEDVWYCNYFESTVSFHKDPENEDILNIRIDLSRVNSLNAVKERISGYFEFELPERNKKYDQKYSLIQKVGELKKQGLTDEAIASEILLERYNDKQSSTTRLINGYVNQYRHLIHGGWRNLRYP